MNKNICGHSEDHVARIERVRASEKYLKSEELANWFKVLSDPARMRIVLTLLEGELCVGHLTEVVGGTQSATSHHLRILRDCKFVKTRREGKSVFYEIDDDHVGLILNTALEHLAEERK